MRKKVNAKAIEKSVLSLLPNNGQCLNEDINSKKYKLKKFLNGNLLQDKFSNIKITPKYFFSNFLISKIKKLRDIFLEFDEDGSSKKFFFNFF
jgi:hypothetical protein